MGTGATIAMAVTTGGTTMQVTISATAAPATTGCTAVAVATC